MSDYTLIQVQELIESAESALKTAQSLMRSMTGISDTNHERNTIRATGMNAAAMSVNGKVVEGVFDGQNMVDANGETYPVPANYASKSKLVEGDGMKLTITEEGKFIYKQISPTDRKTSVGVLIQEDGQYKILADGKVFRVLLASVTFYRAEVGDQVTFLLPTEGDAEWGAIEAVIPKHLAEAAAIASVGSGGMEDDGEMSPAVEEE
ncbi:MAG: hypothetical protein O2904_01605 [bacterium]|nr:hypothetical protein [bacterium]